MKLSIYVISLIDSPRRNTLKERAHSAGVEIEFIDAIEGKNLTTTMKESVYDRKKCIERHGHELSNNEICCFLSHIKAWNKAAYNNHPSIILEDDAIFSDSFLDGLTAISNISHQADVVLLGHSKLAPESEPYHYFKNPLLNKKKHGGFYIGNVYKLWTSGMVGYWLNPASAKKLINNNLLIKCASDDWAYHQENGTSIKEIRPYIIREDFKRLASSLEPDRRLLSSHKKRLYLEPLRIVVGIHRNIRSFFN